MKYGQLAVGITMLLGTAVLGYFTLLAPALESREIRRFWKPATAVIQSNRLIPGYDSDRSEVVYRYLWKGRPFSGSRIGIFGQHTVLPLPRFAPGRSVRCWVNPQQPEEAILRPHFSPDGIWTAVIAIFAIGGGLIALGAIWPPPWDGAAVWDFCYHSSRPAAGRLSPRNICWMPLRPHDDGRPYRREAARDRLRFRIDRRSRLRALLDRLRNHPLPIRESRLEFNLRDGTFRRDDAPPEPLARLTAIQLLVDTSTDPDRTDYEVNLVTRDGRRLPVIRNGNEAKVRADARALAEFLRLPLWDNRMRPADLKELFSPEEAVVTGADDAPTLLAGFSGGGLRTHRLRETDDRIEYRLRPSFRLAGGSVVLGGAAAVVYGVCMVLRQPASGGWMLMLAGGGFGFAATAGLFLLARRRVVFDRIAGACWRDRREPVRVPSPTALNGYTPLERIAALQFLEQDLEAPNGSRAVIGELNLVLRDRTRLHVMSHTEPERLRCDAERIARFLGVPLRSVTGKSDLRSRS